MFEVRRLSIAVLAVVFLGVTTVTYAGVTGPGTTGSDELVPAPGADGGSPDEGPGGLAGEGPDGLPGEAPDGLPDADPTPSGIEVPAAPPLPETRGPARDLGEASTPGAARRAGDGTAGESGRRAARDRADRSAANAGKAGHSAWKAAKKAAMADCRARFEGRERGQCIAAAARTHRNPKARGRR